jgi:hypothetical protein
MQILPYRVPSTVRQNLPYSLLIAPSSLHFEGIPWGQTEEAY